MDKLLFDVSENTKIKIHKLIDEKLQLGFEYFFYILEISSNQVIYGNNDNLIKSFFKIPRSLTNGTYSIHSLSNRDLWKSNVTGGFRYSNVVIDDTKKEFDLKHVFFLFSDKNNLDVVMRKELDYRLHKINPQSKIHFECIGKWTSEKVNLIDIRSSIDLKSEMYSRLKSVTGSMILKQINQQPIYFGELNQNKKHEKKNKHSDHREPIKQAIRYDI